MNLPDFLRAVAGDLVEKAKDGVADMGFEAGFETLIASYRKFCVSFAKRYLDKHGTDHEILRAFRERFIKMMKLTAISLDELDTYLVGRYVDRRGKMLEIYVDVPSIKRELRKVALPGPTKKKRKSNKEIE